MSKSIVVVSAGSPSTRRDRNRTESAVLPGKFRSCDDWRATIPEAVTVLFARRYLLNFPDNTALSVRFRSLLVLGEPADTTTIDFDTSDHPDFGSPGRSQNALPRNGHFIISYDVYMLSAVL